MQEVVVRGMRVEDIPAVLEIQSLCYDATKLESEESFLAKLNASPASCFIAMLAEGPAGYLVSVPIEAHNPPPLNSPVYLVPRVPDSLYLHDLAVHGRARGSGVASALIQAYFNKLRQLGLRLACLTAVNESVAYWERYGFRVVAPVGSVAGRMATYGDGARYMRLALGRHTRTFNEELS